MSEKNDDAVALALAALGVPVEEIARRLRPSGNRSRSQRPVRPALKVNKATSPVDAVIATALAEQHDREKSILDGCREFDGT